MGRSRRGRGGGGRGGGPPAAAGAGDSGSGGGGPGQGGGKPAGARGGRRGGKAGGGGAERRQAAAAAAAAEREQREARERGERERRAAAEEAERERRRGEQARREVAACLAALRDGLAQVEDAAAQFRQRQRLRTANRERVAPGGDSSMKKNEAAIKKLKNGISADSADALLRDLGKLNLTRYIGEAAAAVSEATLKVKDIPAAIRVCSLLHQQYREFGELLLDALKKVWQVGSLSDAAEDKTVVSKRRTSLRLLSELYMSGVHDDLGAITGLVKVLVKTYFTGSKDSAQAALTILVAFIKLVGQDFFGVERRHAPPSIEVSDEKFARVEGARGEVEALAARYAEAIAELGAVVAENFKPPQQDVQMLHMIVTRTCDRALTQVSDEARRLQGIEAANRQALENKGEISDRQKAAYDEAKKEFDTLFRNASAIAEALDREGPKLPEAAGEEEQVAAEDGIVVVKNKELEEAGEDEVFEDENMRDFYESLIDLRAKLPAVLLADGAAPPGKAEGREAEDSAGTGGEGAGEAAAEGPADGATEGAAGASGSEGEEEEEPGDAVTNVKLEDLIASLSTAVSRDACDEIAMKFCYLNSKGARKRLVKAIYGVPRHQMELIPYYCRIVATLSSVFPEIGSGVADLVEKQFRGQTHNRLDVNLDTRIRNVRFLGELVKFRIVFPATVFKFFKFLFEDFTNQNIDATCSLLESCGRFLYRNPPTAVRMKNALEVMMRLRKAKNMDATHDALVENAYYSCIDAPSTAAVVVKQRPPLHEYIRHLVFTELTAASLHKVARQCRKLPWALSEGYLLRVLLKVTHGKFSHIRLVAQLVALLDRFHDSLAIKFTDDILEEIRVGLEQISAPYTQQQRVAQVKLLAEMYNHKLCPAALVLQTLFLILTFGHHGGQKVVEKLDPPQDYFRIRLIVSLLEACNKHLGGGGGRGRARARTRAELDRFLLHFQAYCLSKPKLPMDLHFAVDELYEDWRPQMPRFDILAQAGEAVAAFERTLAERAAQQQLRRQQQHPQGAVGAEAGMDEDDDAGVSSADEDNEEEEEEDAGARAEAEYSEPEDDEGEDSDSEDSDSDSDEDYETESEDELLSEEEEDFEFRPTEEEEEDFDREFKALMQESLGAARLQPAVVNMTAAPGMNTLSQARATGPGAAGGPARPDGMRFQFMMKKAGKVVTKALDVPKSTSLAANTFSREVEAKEERSEIKRLVLEQNELREEQAEALAREQQAEALRNLRGKGALFSNVHHRDGPDRPGRWKTPTWHTDG